MAERILQDGDTIGPGDRLTVFFSAFLGSGSIQDVQGKLVEIFSGTIFPVDKVITPDTVTAAFGFGTSYALTGVAQGQTGLNTTLPGRNIRADEFRAFVETRLPLVPGLWGEHVASVSAGDVTAEAAPIPTRTLIYIAVGLAVVVALAYLISSIGKVGAVVKS